MITENLSTLKIHKLTQEQYNRELAAGNLDDEALYLTPDTAENSAKKLNRIQLPTSGSNYTSHYCKFASATATGAYQGFSSTIAIQDNEGKSFVGIIRIKCRTGATIDNASCSIRWLTLNDTRLSDAISVTKDSDTQYSFYIKTNGDWITYQIIPIDYDDTVTFEVGTSFVESLENVVATSIDDSRAKTADTASKLVTPRHIHLYEGVKRTSAEFDGQYDIQIPINEINESYLVWGGKGLNGTISPVDAAASNLHSANRFQFAKPAGIVLEYSTDNGTTWQSYDSIDDATKVKLVSGIGAEGIFTGGNDTTDVINNQLRITLTASAMGVYTALKKLLMNITTPGHTTYVRVERAMIGSETSFVEMGTYNISGWSGWNSIPIGQTFGGNSSQTYQMSSVRLTFGFTTLNASYSNQNMRVIDIVAIGDTYWTYPSEMAKSGHLYQYDDQQNAIFPANVKAANFLDNNGNSLTSLIGNKVDKVSGKGLSTNDFTDAYKNKIDNSKNYSEGLELTLNHFGNESHYYVTGIGTCTDEEIRIPSMYNGVPIRYIDSYAFEGLQIKSIIIDGDGDIHIQEYAFENCTNLENVIIGKNVSEIGDQAFKNCTSLKSIVIPKSVVEMNPQVFRGCSNDLQIYCEAESQPDSWDPDWNSDGFSVTWGSAVTLASINDKLKNATIPVATATTLGGLYVKVDESTGTLVLSTTPIE